MEVWVGVVSPPDRNSDAYTHGSVCPAVVFYVKVGDCGFDL